jgi:hypothetical protein
MQGKNPDFLTAQVRLEIWQPSGIFVQQLYKVELIGLVLERIDSASGSLQLLPIAAVQPSPTSVPKQIKPDNPPKDPK